MGSKRPEKVKKNRSSVCQFFYPFLDIFSFFLWCNNSKWENKVFFLSGDGDVVRGGGQSSRPKHKNINFSFPEIRFPFFKLLPPHQMIWQTRWNISGRIKKQWMVQIKKYKTLIVRLLQDEVTRYIILCSQFWFHSRLGKSDRRYYVVCLLF